VRASRPLRTLLYCHDTYGLGHLRRTLSVATMLSASPLDGARLVVSGSPLGQRFPFPPGTDLVSLPAVVKVGAGRYEPRALPIGYPAIRAIRRELILAVARTFRPDLVLVDHAPGGLDGEILPALHDLRREAPGTRLVLGLRDVLDESSCVKAAWQRDGSHALLDELYDRVVVYGERDIYDVTKEYGFSNRAADKTRFVGYLGRSVSRLDREAVLARHGLDAQRLALVTMGGGGDGARLAQAVIGAIRTGRAPSDLAWLMVGGPLMPTGAWEGLVSAAAALPGVRLVRFLDDLPSHVRAADLVVSMGGYNTVCEILASGRPALIVPRTEPRQEQWIRAGLLEQRGLVRVLHPEGIGPQALLREIRALAETDPRPLPDRMLDGLPRLEAELVQLMGTGPTEVAAVAGRTAAGVVPLPVDAGSMVAA